MKHLGLLLVSLLSLEASAVVRWKNSPTWPVEVKAGTEFRIDLKDPENITATDITKVKFFATQTPEPHNPPPWLTIDLVNGILSGRPQKKDAGTSQFNLLAREGDTSTDWTKMHLTVVIPIDPPEWVASDIDLGIQTEDSPWTDNLNNYIKTPDPNGGPVTFTASGLQEWMTLEPGGKISGTPKRKHEGDYSGIVFTATNKAGSVPVNAHGTVKRIPHRPKWTQNPILLPNANEDSSYTQDLAGFTDKGDAETLTFEIINHSEPVWAKIGDTSGTIFGTPTVPTKVDLRVRLKGTIDGTLYSDTTTVTFEVLPVNDPPYWVADPISLPDAFTKVSMSHELGSSAKDEDGDKLTFKIESGPTWVTMNAETGKFSGTPDKTHLGENRWVVSATDPGGLSARTTVIVKVLKSNEPPYWVNKPTFLPEGNEDSKYEVDLTKYAVDPDNDPITFQKLQGPAWATISSTGTMMGTPGATDTGMQTFTVLVTDKISSPNDVSEVKVLIIHTNHAPFWVLDPIKLRAKEDKPFSQSIAPYAKDPDNDVPLTFSLLSGPSWASFSKDGTFTGTPGKDHVGPNEFVAVVGDPGGLTAQVKVIIEVEHTNHKPTIQDPITLASVDEEKPFSESIAKYASDPDGDSLEFAKVNGPAWITVGKDGLITGTPPDPGTFSFLVRVQDPSKEWATATVTVTVNKVNHAPRWRQNPILLTTALEDTTYTFDLSEYATDPDGDALTFSKVEGPAWLFVGEDGKITGVPTGSDVGNYTAIFRVSDGSLHADTNGQGKVDHKNHPPVIDPTMPVFEILEREVFQLDLLKYITDSDGDKLTCNDVSKLDWVKIGADCKLEARPQFKHISQIPWEMKFRVDDTQLPAYGTVKLIVKRNPRPPVWLEEPIVITARTNEPVVASLASKVKDPDGLPITISKVEGGDWLTVAPDGTLTGTPTDAQLGENPFKVRACNTDPSCADNTLIVKVIPGTHIDTVQVDAIVPGAPAEYLWVVDHSNHCVNTIKALKKDIRIFYEELNKAQLHHTGLFISADAKDFDGLPIHDKNQNALMLWSDPNQPVDFVSRLTLAYSGDDCGNCDNSPIWSMYRLFLQAPTLPENIYKNGYWMERVPIDSMMVTHQKDHFKWYTKNIPELKNYTATDFARSYVSFHNQTKQRLRVSAIAPACPKLEENFDKEGFAAPDNAYSTVVNLTGGKYYTSGCDFNMANVLRDYAKRIAFRAHVFAKQRIELSKTPMTPNGIKVYLGDKELAPDKWSFESPKTIIIFWELIGIDNIKPGDILKIEYRVS